MLVARALPRTQVSQWAVDELLCAAGHKTTDESERRRARSALKSWPHFFINRVTTSLAWAVSLGCLRRNGVVFCVNGPDTRPLAQSNLMLALFTTAPHSACSDLR